jgi:hypothetical protein
VRVDCWAAAVAAKRRWRVENPKARVWSDGILGGGCGVCRILFRLEFIRNG